MDRLKQKIEPLTNIPTSRFFLHEKVVCIELKLKPTEGSLVREQLSSFLNALTKGHHGSVKKALPLALS